jgi:hypothetical protein
VKLSEFPDVTVPVSVFLYLGRKKTLHLNRPNHNCGIDKAGCYEIKAKIPFREIDVPASVTHEARYIQFREVVSLVRGWHGGVLRPLTMRLSDAGLRRRQTELFYPNHRSPPWLTEDATGDRSNRLLGVLGTIGICEAINCYFYLKRVPGLVLLQNRRCTMEVY